MDTPRLTCKWEGCEATPGSRSGYCVRHRKLARAHGLTHDNICSDQTCDAPAFTRGMCRVHYRRWLEANVKPPCSDEGCDEPVAASGLCRKHYMRMRRTGSTGDERKNARKTCTADDCNDVVVSGGLCNKHHKRLKRLGVVELPERPEFVAPAGFHCRWCGEALPTAPQGKLPFCCPEHAALFKQAERNTPEAKARRRELHLRRSYGISAEDYDALLAEQAGVCAICKSEGSATERSERLAVDHDHETGIVRGLLCHDCNTGIGKLGDDPARLRSAADYIERHRAVDGG